MIRKDVEEIRSIVHSTLNKKTVETTNLIKYDSQFVDRVKEIPIEVMNEAVGPLGKKLKDFCCDVDLEHPAIQQVLETALTSTSEFVNLLKQVLDLVEYSKDKDMSAILRLTKDGLLKDKDLKGVCSSIFKPPIRAIKSLEKREMLRKEKTGKKVELKDWMKNNKSWNHYPSDFKYFCRLNDSYKQEHEINLRKVVKLEELEVPAIANAFRTRFDHANSFFGDTAFGFVRLKMSDCAIVLAKMLYGSYSYDAQSIMIDRKAVESCQYWVNANTSYPAYFTENPDRIVADILVKEYALRDQIVYKPQAYPLYELQPYWTEYVQHIVEVLEKHADMNGKPIFDQYWAIVPGILPSIEEFCYSGTCVLKRDDQCELFKDQESFLKALDHMLITKGAINPAILGEIDGKCYFVTLWQ